MVLSWGELLRSDCSGVKQGRIRVTPRLSASFRVLSSRAGARRESEKYPRLKGLKLDPGSMRILGQDLGKQFSQLGMLQVGLGLM